jgi:hypothetical protein
MRGRGSQSRSLTFWCVASEQACSRCCYSRRRQARGVAHSPIVHWDSLKSSTPPPHRPPPAPQLSEKAQAEAAARSMRERLSKLEAANRALQAHRTQMAAEQARLRSELERAAARARQQQQQQQHFGLPHGPKPQAGAESVGSGASSASSAQAPLRRAQSQPVGPAATGMSTALEAAATGWLGAPPQQHQQQRSASAGAGAPGQQQQQPQGAFASKPAPIAAAVATHQQRSDPSSVPGAAAAAAASASAPKPRLPLPDDAGAAAAAEAARAAVVEAQEQLRAQHAREMAALQAELQRYRGAATAAAAAASSVPAESGRLAGEADQARRQNGFASAGEGSTHAFGEEEGPVLPARDTAPAVNAARSSTQATPAAAAAAQAFSAWEASQRAASGEAPRRLLDVVLMGHAEEVLFLLGRADVAGLATGLAAASLSDRGGGQLSAEQGQGRWQSRAAATAAITAGGASLSYVTGVLARSDDSEAASAGVIGGATSAPLPSERTTPQPGVAAAVGFGAAGAGKRTTGSLLSSHPWQGAQLHHAHRSVLQPAAFRSSGLRWPGGAGGAAAGEIAGAEADLLDHSGVPSTYVGYAMDGSIAGTQGGGLSQGVSLSQAAGFARSQFEEIDDRFAPKGPSPEASAVAAASAAASHACSAGAGAGKLQSLQSPAGRGKDGSRSRKGAARTAGDGVSPLAGGAGAAAVGLSTGPGLGPAAAGGVFGLQEAAPRNPDTAAGGIVGWSLLALRRCSPGPGLKRRRRAAGFGGGVGQSAPGASGPSGWVPRFSGESAALLDAGGANGAAFAATASPQTPLLAYLQLHSRLHLASWQLVRDPISASLADIAAAAVASASLLVTTAAYSDTGGMAAVAAFARPPPAALSAALFAALLAALTASPHDPDLPLVRRSRAGACFELQPALAPMTRLLSCLAAMLAQPAPATPPAFGVGDAALADALTASPLTCLCVLRLVRAMALLLPHAAAVLQAACGATLCGGAQPAALHSSTRTAEPETAKAAPPALPAPRPPRVRFQGVVLCLQAGGSRTATASSSSSSSSTSSADAPRADLLTVQHSLQRHLAAIRALETAAVSGSAAVAASCEGADAAPIQRQRQLLRLSATEAEPLAALLSGLQLQDPILWDGRSADAVAREGLRGLQGACGSLRTSTFTAVVGGVITLPPTPGDGAAAAARMGVTAVIPALAACLQSVRGAVRLLQGDRLGSLQVLHLLQRTLPEAHQAGRMISLLPELLSCSAGRGGETGRSAHCSALSKASDGILPLELVSATLALASHLLHPDAFSLSLPAAARLLHGVAAREGAAAFSRGYLDRALVIAATDAAMVQMGAHPLLHLCLRLAQLQAEALAALLAMLRRSFSWYRGAEQSPVQAAADATAAAGAATSSPSHQAAAVAAAAPPLLISGLVLALGIEPCQVASQVPQQPQSASGATRALVGVLHATGGSGNEGPAVSAAPAASVPVPAQQRQPPPAPSAAGKSGPATRLGSSSSSTGGEAEEGADDAAEVEAELGLVDLLAGLPQQERGDCLEPRPRDSSASSDAGAASASAAGSGVGGGLRKNSRSGKAGNIRGAPAASAASASATRPPSHLAAGGPGSGLAAGLRGAPTSGLSGGAGSSAAQLRPQPASKGAGAAPLSGRKRGAAQSAAELQRQQEDTAAPSGSDGAGGPAGPQGGRAKRLRFAASAADEEGAAEDGEPGDKGAREHDTSTAVAGVAERGQGEGEGEGRTSPAAAAAAYGGDASALFSDPFAPMALPHLVATMAARTVELAVVCAALDGHSEGYSAPSSGDAGGGGSSSAGDGHAGPLLRAYVAALERIVTEAAGCLHSYGSVRAALGTALANSRRITAAQYAAAAAASAAAAVVTSAGAGVAGGAAHATAPQVQTKPQAPPDPDALGLSLPTLIDTLLATADRLAAHPYLRNRPLLRAARLMLCEVCEEEPGHDAAR